MNFWKKIYVGLPRAGHFNANFWNFFNCNLRRPLMYVLETLKCTFKTLLNVRLRDPLMYV